MYPAFPRNPDLFFDWTIPAKALILRGNPFRWLRRLVGMGTACAGGRAGGCPRRTNFNVRKIVIVLLCIMTRKRGRFVGSARVPGSEFKVVIGEVTPDRKVSGPLCPGLEWS